MQTAQVHVPAALEILLREQALIDDHLRSIRAVLGGPQITTSKRAAVTEASVPARTRKRRKLSAAARRRMSQAQKKRWARYHAQA
jgi:hypothetical protein